MALLLCKWPNTSSYALNHLWLLLRNSRGCDFFIILCGMWSSNDQQAYKTGSERILFYGRKSCLWSQWNPRAQPGIHWIVHYRTCGCNSLRQCFVLCGVSVYMLRLICDELKAFQLRGYLRQWRFKHLVSCNSAHCHDSASSCYC